MSAHPDRRRRVLQHGLAFGWGLAESTAFFVVPDVWTSAVGLRHPRRAQALTVTAALGAVAGGAVVHRWSARTPPARTAALAARIPAISPAMVAAVDRQIARHGMAALLIGPFTGTPYKLYARSVGALGLPPGPLLAWTVPARLVRFVPVTAAISGAAALSRRAGLSAPGGALPRLLGVSPRALERLVLALGWGVFYLWFLRSVGREGAVPDDGHRAVGSRTHDGGRRG